MLSPLYPSSLSYNFIYSHHLVNNHYYLRALILSFFSSFILSLPSFSLSLLPTQELLGESSYPPREFLLFLQSNFPSLHFHHENVISLLSLSLSYFRSPLFLIKLILHLSLSLCSLNLIHPPAPSLIMIKVTGNHYTELQRCTLITTVHLRA